MNEKKKAAYRLGVMVLIGLAVLTIIEFYVALLPSGAITALFIIALIKAWAILQYFMHIKNLWAEEEGH